MKLFTVPEITFKGHSQSQVMSSFIPSPELYIRDWKKWLHLFSEKTSWNDLEGWSRSSAMVQFNRPHCQYSFCQWSVVTVYSRPIVSELFSIE